MIEIIDVTDDAGRVVRPDWLARSERVHGQLRKFRAAYADAVAPVFAGGGRMRVAARGGEVEGVAIYRVYVETHSGLMMYVDDLVTDETKRSSGVGKALLSSLEKTARDLGCEYFTLDSGTQRQRAHAFYFREGMKITAFHFVKPLR